MMQPKQCPDCGATVDIYRGPGRDRLRAALKELVNAANCMEMTVSNNHYNAGISPIADPDVERVRAALAVARAVLEETK